jgi:hypothetical protein
MPQVGSPTPAIGHRIDPYEYRCREQVSVSARCALQASLSAIGSRLTADRRN